MDGKYAKYIENFMKGFTSTKETTEIYALNNTKRPLVYDTTSELIESKNNKLNDQYSTIIKKQDEIKANEFKKLEKTSKLFGIITTLAIIITILLFVPSITASVNFIIPQIGTVISLLLGTTYAGLKTKLEIGKKKFEYDVWYVDHCSFMLDLKIIFLTIKKVFFREDISKEGEATTVPFDGTN